MFLPHPRVKVSIVGSLRDREVACSASDRQGSNFESCVWRTVSSQSSHHPQEVLLAQFSLYVHKSGLKPDSFHFHFIYPLTTGCRAEWAMVKLLTANTKYSANPGSALGQRRRRWANVEQTSAKHIFFYMDLPYMEYCQTLVWCWATSQTLG